MAAVTFVVAVGTCITPHSVDAAIYQPGETLNPSCAPSDPLCTVATTTATTISNYFIATGNTASILPYASATAVTIDGGTDSSSTLFLGTLSGILRAVAGRVQSVANVFYDDATGRLGIGSDIPGAMLDITNSANADPVLIARDALGTLALEVRAATSTLHDTFIGVGAGASNGTGASSTAVGFQSLYSNTAGNQNTALGASTLYSNTSGSNNTAVGYRALFSNTTGENNTAIGWRAMELNVSGADNSAVGEYALFSNDGGSENTAFGESALYANTNGSYNMALGFSALYSNTVGESNIALGHSALYSNTVGSNNIAIGPRSLFGNISAADNIAIGDHSLHTNDVGSENTSVGSESLFYNTNGSYNSAFGRQSMYSNTTGINNTALGHQALYSNTVGVANTAVGEQSLYTNSTGSYSVGVGVLSLSNNMAATTTVAVGVEAASGAAVYANQGGTYLGYRAGYSAASASDFNTFVGYKAGQSVTTGANNVIVGAATVVGAEENLTTGSGNILVGTGVALSSSTASGQLNVGNIIYGANNIGTGQTVSTGTVGIGTTTPWGRLSVKGSGTEAGLAFVVADNADTPRLIIRDNGIIGVGTITPDEGRIEVKGDTVCVDTDGNDQATSCIADESDERLKKNVAQLTGALDTILRLRGVRFDWRIDDPEIVIAHPLIGRFAGRPHDVGVIAQEVAPVWPEAIDRETIDGFYQVDYKKFVPLLIEGMKEQQGQVRALQAAVAEVSAQRTNGTAPASVAPGTTVQAEKLCVGSVCITEAELRALLHAQPVSAPTLLSVPTANGERVSEDVPASQPEEIPAVPDATPAPVPPEQPTEPSL